jgi:hypothetical protein
MNNGAAMNGLGEAIATPQVPRRTIPFDYVFRFDEPNKNELKGQPGLVHNSTVDISIEAAFTAVSIGYGVVPKVHPIIFGLPPPQTGTIFLLAVPPPPPPPSPPSPPPPARLLFNTTLGQLLETLSTNLDEAVTVSDGEIDGKIGPRTAAVFRDGLRFNPEFAERLLLTGGAERDEGILSQAFQAVGAPPERVAFKYALFDQGSGREFQSEPILNIAGLGSPDGKRPFRYFARPIEFAPRSTIRLQIIEVSAFQGELHVSLQGYKTLGAPGTPTGVRPSRRMRRIRR